MSITVRVNLQDLLILLGSDIYTSRGPYADRLLEVMGKYGLSEDVVKSLRSVNLAYCSEVV